MIKKTLLYFAFLALLTFALSFSPFKESGRQRLLSQMQSLVNKCETLRKRALKLRKDKSEEMLFEYLLLLEDLENEWESLDEPLSRSENRRYEKLLDKLY